MLETHYERNLVVNNREIEHHGYFVIEEVFHLINKALQDKKYHKREKRAEDTVTDEGYDVYVELRPYKEKTNYVTLMIKLRIHFKNVKNVVRQVPGGPKRFQQGDVFIFMDAWFMTEWEGRWGMSPVIFFLKGAINKLLYVFPQEASYRNEAVEDAAYLTAKIKMLLRSYNDPEQAFPTEEDVRKSVEEEISKSKDA
ncbi:MAG TPA: hypothetical protein VJI15_04950 [Candidatus Nanoarchaeia archaeon]|nr:hypothetical protein [Candidatus Nanoarchaeia archaeon]